MPGYRRRSREQWLGVEKLGRGLVRRACVALHRLERKAAAASRRAGAGVASAPGQRPPVVRSARVVRPAGRAHSARLRRSSWCGRGRSAALQRRRQCGMHPPATGRWRQPAARRVVKTTAPSSGLGFRVLQSVGLHADQADRPGLQRLDSTTQRCGARQRVWAVGEGRPICQGAVAGLRGCG